LSFIDKLSSPKDDTDLHYDSSREMARGVSWAVLMRWCMRCIGLASTLILARLLSPDDFGVAAMGTLLVGFVGTFTDVGVTQHLIRAREIDRAHCDTAWTIGFLQSVFISIALVALAYPAAAYFGEPRVVNVIYVLALAVFIGGFCSIGLVLARRELNFALDFRFQIYKKLLIFGATVGAALYLRSYWALVLGYLAGTITSVVLSYVMHPYRPAWSLAKMREYLSFGLYVMPLRLGNVLHKMAPKFIVGGLGSASTLGAFTVSNGLASTFTAEIVVPMGRGLFPNYARLAGDKPGLSAVYRQILALVSLVVIPIGTGMSAVASCARAQVDLGRSAHRIPCHRCGDLRGLAHHEQPDPRSHGPGALGRGAFVAEARDHGTDAFAWCASRGSAWPRAGNHRCAARVPAPDLPRNSPGGHPALVGPRRPVMASGCQCLGHVCGHQGVASARPAMGRAASRLRRGSGRGCLYRYDAGALAHLGAPRRRRAHRHQSATQAPAVFSDCLDRMRGHRDSEGFLGS